MIEGVYMVANDSPVRGNDDIDRGGTRVGVIVGSAYDLFLSRELKQATIVRAADAAAVMDLWAGESSMPSPASSRSSKPMRSAPADCASAGAVHGDQPGDGNAPRARAGARYLAHFVEDVKASGFVAEAFARNRIDGASLAP